MASFASPNRQEGSDSGAPKKLKGTPQHKLRKFVIKSKKRDKKLYTSVSDSGSKLVAKILTGKSSKKIVLHQKNSNGEKIEIAFGIDDVSRIEMNENSLTGGSNCVCHLTIDSLPRPGKLLPEIFNDIADDDSSVQVELSFLGRGELKKFHTTIYERSEWLREKLVVSPSKDLLDVEEEAGVGGSIEQLSSLSIRPLRIPRPSDIATSYVPLIVRIICLTDNFVPFNVGTGFFVEDPTKKDGTKCVVTCKHVVSKIQQNGIEAVKKIFIGVTEAIDEPPKWCYNVNMSSIAVSSEDVAVLLLHEYIMETKPESNVVCNTKSNCLEKITIVKKSTAKQFQEKMRSFKG
jgi:hypothetical protein